MVYLFYFCMTNYMILLRINYIYIFLVLKFNFILILFVIINFNIQNYFPGNNFGDCFIFVYEINTMFHVKHFLYLIKNSESYY